MGELSYREWSHLKEKNLICIWLIKLNTQKQKASVFVTKKKQVVKEELEKIQKINAKENPGIS